MRKIFTLFAIVICGSLTSSLFAQNTKTATQKQSLSQQESVLTYDENKIPLASVRQAQVATRKDSKDVLIYLGKHSDGKIPGASFVDTQVYGDDKIAKKINRLNDDKGDVYLLSWDEKQAKRVAFILSNSKEFKNVKVYVIKGGVEAWKKQR